MGDLPASLNVARVAAYRRARPAALDYADVAPPPRRAQPRQMRPAEERVRDANPGVQQQARRELGPVARDRVSADIDQHAAMPPPREQTDPEEAGQMAWEMTPFPHARRAAFHLGRSATGRADEWGQGALELGATALNAWPLAEGAGALGRVPRRAPVAEPATPLPQSPTRDLGYASDGSVLPIAPRTPFRNSLRGGSADLSEAAASGPQPFPDFGSPALPASRSRAPTPDAGGAWLRHLRDQGFDVERPLYRGGGPGAAERGGFRVGSGIDGDGVYLTDQPPIADEYARARYPNGLESPPTFEEGATVYPVFARNAEKLSHNTYIVRNPEDIAPRFGRAPSSPDGGAVQARPRLAPPGPNEYDVFHGTAAEFDQFDPARRGSNYQEPDVRHAFFFSSSPRRASEFAEDAVHNLRGASAQSSPEYRAANERAQEAYNAAKRAILPWTRATRQQLYRDATQARAVAYENVAHGANVRPERVTLRNPQIVDDLDGYDADAFAEILQEAKAAGHDGVIFRSLNDSPTGKGRSDVYAVFDASNVRSRFDPSNVHIKGTPKASPAEGAIDTGTSASTPNGGPGAAMRSRREPQ